MASAWHAHAQGRSPKEMDDLMEAALMAANEATASSASSHSTAPSAVPTARPALPVAWVSAGQDLDNCQLNLNVKNREKRLRAPGRAQPNAS